MSSYVFDGMMLEATRMTKKEIEDVAKRWARLGFVGKITPTETSLNHRWAFYRTEQKGGSVKEGI